MKLNQKQKQALKKVAEKYGLSLILLFGSQANGQKRPDSDFDMAVKFKDKVKMDKILDINRELIDIFRQDVDLSVINTANPLLLHQINKNHKLLYGRKRDYYCFRIYAFNRYNDYAPFFKLEEEFIKQKIKEYAA